MALTLTEFEALLADPTKTIDGDIRWVEDEDHSPGVEFRAFVQNQQGYPLYVRGSYNPLAGTLSYVLILQTEGRIYALDLGKEHKNPDETKVGEKHKHAWTELFRDRHAYEPKDITAPAGDLIAVWRQFCEEAGLRHNGQMNPPPAVQKELWP